MARVHLLSESVISRIAAGEVVERPASAVKELIENAIDARARTIEVALEGGGRDAIVVTDDGEGMSTDDLLLALERHATSKISSDADIEEVRTLGFRGEAIPSIASVCRFRMSSRDAQAETATVVEVNGGRLATVREEPAQRGTRVEVLGLFYNAPARRKFLRAAETERQKIVEMVSRFAIGYPEIRFRVLAEKRTIFDHTAVSEPLERCAQILGRQLAGRLLTVDMVRGDLHAVGLASGLAETRAHARDQHLFVNRRPVKDRLLSHAVSMAYAEVLPRGRAPVLVLLLEIPPALVDVNVHPSKTEVRFRRPGEAHDFIVEALRTALRNAGVFPHLGYLKAPGPASSPAQDGGAWAGEPGSLSAAAQGASWMAGDEPGSERGLLSPGLTSPQPQLPRSGGYTYAPSAIPEPTRLSDAGAGAFPGAEVGATLPRDGRTWEPDWTDAQRAPVESVVPLGQFLDSYILARDRDGLLIVDQHVAHERVLFERLLEASGTSAAPSQRLLTPLSLELSAVEGDAVRSGLESLGAAGFELEEFGTRALIVRAIPAQLEEADPERLVREMISDLAAGVHSGPPEEQRRRIAASAACHAAIKVHFPLNVAKMAWLLNALLRCDVPTTCPHGRPIVLRIGQEEIERGFHRR